VRFTKVTVGSARDQAARAVACLHHREQRRKILRGQRQIIPNAGQVPVGSIIVTNDLEDDARDQGFGLFVPMRFGFSFIEHQRIGERHGIFGQVEAADFKPVERRISRQQCHEYLYTLALYANRTI
jgi:hypothetical protein